MVGDGVASACAAASIADQFMPKDCPRAGDPGVVVIISEGSGAGDALP